MSRLSCRATLAALAFPLMLSACSVVAVKDAPPFVPMEDAEIKVDPVPMDGVTTGDLSQVRKIWYPSPNFDARKPNYVIIHHTNDNTVEEARWTLTNPAKKVSAHYLIGRDGKVIQMVEETARAWHAGRSWWGGQTDINSASIGIELDNNGDEPFAEAQLTTLLSLLTELQQRYSIPAANFIGHADVAPTRKDDPSPHFPWKRLAEQGFGLWYDEPLPPAPAGFDLWVGLAALGYNPDNPEAARTAFRRHFFRGEQKPTLKEERAMAYNLLQKKFGLSGK